MKFEVSFDNEILGKGSRIMTLEEIKGYNLTAYTLARYCEQDYKKRRNGMWTVKRLEEDNA